MDSGVAIRRWRGRGGGGLDVMATRGAPHDDTLVESRASQNRFQSGFKPDREIMIYNGTQSCDHLRRRIQ